MKKGALCQKPIRKDQKKKFALQVKLGINELLWGIGAPISCRPQAQICLATALGIGLQPQPK